MNNSPVAKLREGGLVRFDCPGCGFSHAVPVSGQRAWGFNGDFVNPTFTPSILVRGTERVTDDEHARIMRGEHVEPRTLVCHSFVTDGRIQFLGDCTHSLAGQTVALPPVDNEA